MKTIRLKNIRRFEDSGEIDFPGITLLLGCNSSGKSTIARLLPLLKQSVNTETRSPLLWNGELVDWGEFDDITNHEGDICIEFSITPQHTKKYLNKPELDYNIDEVWHACLKLRKKDRIHFCCHVSIECKSFSIKYDILENSSVENLKINGEEQSTENLFSHRSEKSIIPMCYTSLGGTYYHPSLAVNFFNLKRRGIENDLTPLNELYNKALNLFHGRTSKDKITRFLDRCLRLGPVSSNTLLVFFHSNPNIFGSKLDYIQHLTVDDEIVADIHRLLISIHMPSITHTLDSSLTNVANSIQYANPLRATAKRYYRKSDLSVSHVSPDGSNLPEVIGGLSARMADDLSQYCLDSLGFELKAKHSSGHISLQVKSLVDSKFMNITDVGFGIPQVLPLVVQSWMQQRKQARAKKTSVPTTFVIEQPELHLHPKMQADYATSVALSANNKICNYLIETHSESIVRRLLQMVKKGEISKDLISIYCIEAEKTGKSKVRKAEISDKGTLSNWPYDFFDTY